MTMQVLGLDIGGANLKAAHVSGRARTEPFPLWRAPGELPPRLARLLEGWPPFDHLAVTMTGEICDCFPTKREGVRTILDAVAAVARVPVRVWTTLDRFVSLAGARDEPLSAAAANWLALAHLAGRFKPSGAGLLLDCGSTTTDLVPLWRGRPVPRGRSDPERLRTGELVYSGARRTPVCALLGLRGAAEFFATTQDVYLVLNETAAAADDCDTADSRPATRPFAEARLARMMGADLETSTPAQRLALARRVANRQVAGIVRAMRRVVTAWGQRPTLLILSGSGEFLARRVVRAFDPEGHVRITSLAAQFSPEVSHAACAFAVAFLAAERGPGA